MGSDIQMCAAAIHGLAELGRLVWRCPKDGHVEICKIPATCEAMVRPGVTFLLTGSRCVRRSFTNVGQAAAAIPIWNPHCVTCDHLTTMAYVESL